MFEDENYFSESEYYPHLTKIDSAINTMVARLEEGNDVIPTGYKSLDDLIGGGWQKGDMIILGGFPSSGKTSLALNFALYAANQGYPVVFFTLHTASHLLVQRLFSIHANEPLRFDSKEQYICHRINEIGHELSSIPFYMDDSPRLEYDRLRGKILETLESVRDALVVIDYINIMQPPAVYQGMREQEMSAISREIKITARELNIPIIAVAELNPSKSRKGYSSSRPSLNDLKESSSLEYDADVVILTELETGLGCYYDEENYDPNGMKMIVAKNRRGYVSDLRMRFDKETGLIEEFKSFSYSDSSYNDMVNEESDNPLETPENSDDNEQDSDISLS